MSSIFYKQPEINLSNEGLYRPPIELIDQKVRERDAQIDEGLSQIDIPEEIAGMAHNFEREDLKKWYTSKESEQEELAKTIRDSFSNPANISKLVKNWQKDIKKELTIGELSRLSENKKILDATLKQMENTQNPELRKAYLESLKNNLNTFKEEEGSTKILDETFISNNSLAKDMDIEKDFLDYLKSTGKVTSKDIGYKTIIDENGLKRTYLVYKDGTTPNIKPSEMKKAVEDFLKTPDRTSYLTNREKYIGGYTDKLKESLIDLGREIPSSSSGTQIINETEESSARASGYYSPEKPDLAAVSMLGLSDNERKNLEVRVKELAKNDVNILSNVLSAYGYSNNDIFKAYTKVTQDILLEKNINPNSLNDVERKVYSVIIEDNGETLLQGKFEQEQFYRNKAITSMGNLKVFPQFSSFKTDELEKTVSRAISDGITNSSFKIEAPASPTGNTLTTSTDSKEREDFIKGLTLEEIKKQKFFYQVTTENGDIFYTFEAPTSNYENIEQLFIKDVKVKKDPVVTYTVTDKTKYDSPENNYNTSLIFEVSNKEKEESKRNQRYSIDNQEEEVKNIITYPVKISADQVGLTINK